MGAVGGSGRRGRGRPADPVEAENPEAARRAEALRALVDEYRDRQRAATGTRPTYGDVAAAVHYSAATLSRALKYGTVSKEVALAVFGLCRGPDADGAAWWLALAGTGEGPGEASASASPTAATPGPDPNTGPESVRDESACPTCSGDTQAAETPPPRPVQPPTTKPARRRRVWIAAGIALVVVAGACVVVIGVRKGDDSDAPTLTSATPTTLAPTALPGGPRGPSVAQDHPSTAKPTVLVPRRPEFGAGCTGYPWFPDYATAQGTLAALPPSEREGIGARTGTEVRFSVQGATTDAVLLERARIVVDARRPATGVRLDDHACGSPKIQAKFAVDLRPAQPRLTAEPGSDQDIAIPARPFPFSVSSTDMEDFVFGVTGIDDDVEWHIEIEWESMLGSGTLRIDDHGAPFRTTSAPTAKCGPDFTACAPPTTTTP